MCEKDVENLIKEVHPDNGCLNCRVFNNHSPTIRTKIMVFRALVISTLLYAYETWTLYRRDIKGLEHFQQYKLRQMHKIQWENFITNTEVLNRTSLPSVQATVINHRLRWTGHILRMDPSQLPRIMLNGKPAIGGRSR